jgi:hypothetical protein
MSLMVVLKKMHYGYNKVFNSVVNYNSFIIVYSFICENLIMS